MAKELAPGASVPQEDALLASCDDASGSDLDGSASGALSASPPSSAHAALAGREGVEPRSADGLQSRGATQLAGTKHAASSSPSPPPKKRHITPKARPKKMQEILRRTETEVSSAPFSSPASSAVSVPASPPGSASKLEPPVCPESTLCTGRSFEELMAAAGIDMSQPLPPDSSSLSGARGGATGRSGLTRRGASTTGSVAGPRRGEKKDEKRESGAKARDASSGRFPASRPSSAVSTAGGSSPLSDSPALTASEGHSPALRLPLSERAPATQARSGEERVANLLELSKEPGRFPDISPSPRVLNADASALALPGRESQYAPASPPASPSSSLACSSSAPACGSEPSSSSPTASAEPAFGGEASEHEVFAAIPLSLRLTSKTVKHRVHGCEELLQRFVTQPEKSSETFAANLQGATLERLLKDSNPLVLSKVVDFMLAYVRAVAGAGRVALSAERAVSLLQAVAPPTLQNVLANPRLAPQAGEFLSLLAAVHPEALSCLMSLVIAANAKLLAEKKGNVALLKGAAIKQLTAALQLLQTLVEDFGVPAINAAGGLKLLLEKSVGPFCCVSDKKVRGVCTALAAHAVWLAGASEAAKKLATDAVKNSKAMQTDVLALLEAKDSEAQRDKPKRVFRLGASAEAPDGEGVPSRKGEDRDGEVVLAEETDVLKLVCQQGDWTQRVTEGKQKKAAGNNAPEPSENELPWKVKMQAWQQLEEALRDCVCMAKKNPFLPSLLSLVHRCLTLEPTLPVVSCCLRVLQHLVRHLLSDLSAASFASFSSAGSSSPPQQLRVLLPGVAAKLKVNNRQVQVAATSCLGAFLRALPLDVACAELLPMKEKLAGYRQALLEALAAAVPAETENEEPRLAARNLAFWRATPLLVQAAKAGADDGAPGVRTAALQLLAKIGGKGEGGAAAISSVLDALQDQKRQQVLKLMAAVPSSSSSAASSPSPLAALSSAVTGCRKQLRPARVPSLASGIEQSQAGAAASRSSLRGPEKEKRAKGDEDERRGREEKMKPCKTDEKRRPRERKDSDAENKQPLSARGRADPVASHRPHTAGAHRGASPSSSSSWSSLSFALSWDVPDCPVSLAEAERVAERMWEAELLAGLRSPNGLARRGACERLAEWWRRPCECRACARKLAASEEASSATEQQECKDPEGEKECLQRTKSQYAVHLILFMRVSVANFREKSLAVQEAVLACLAAAVESLTLSGKPRTPEEKEETPLTITSAFDVQNPKPEKAETKRRPVHPSLAALIVAPLVDKIGDPRVGSKVQTLCLSLAEVFSSPLPVAASLIEAAEGNLVVSLPVSPGVPSTVRSGSLEKRQERQGDLWPDERRREGFPLKKSGETGACTARIGERPRVGCASAIGGATGRACQALCAVLERLVHDWGYEKLTPVKTLVLFARQIIDGQKATAAQANRSGGMRLMAELCAQLGEKNLHSILLSQPLPDDLRTAVKHLAESLSRQSPSSNRSPLGAPHQATSSVAPVSLVERAMQCFSSGAAFVASAVGEIAGPGSELYLHRARKPVSVAPLLTQECLGVLQSSQKKPFGEKKGQAAKDEKEEVAALKECIRVIAVEGGGCIKAEGLSTLVPILRSKVGDPRPAVSRFALLLASAVCDALAKQPGQCKDEEERRTETGQECGTETGAGDAERTRGENKRPSRGCHLYKDSLLPAIFDRLHGTDRRTVELAHIATLKWLQAIGPEEAVPLLLPCLERALSALPRSASFSGRLGSSSPRVLSSLSFSLSSSVSSSLASSVSSSLSSSVSSSLSSSVSSSLSSVPAREADSADGLGRKVGEALIALLVASRFSFGASAGVSEAHAATLSRRLLPLLFSLLRAALKARESSRDARESSRAAEVVDLLEALIAQVERHLGDAAAAGVEAEKQKIRAWEAVCASERASDARERAEEHTPLGEPRLRSGGEASDVEVRMEEAGDVQGEKGGDRGDQGGEKEVACVPGACVPESSPVASTDSSTSEGAKTGEDSEEEGIFFHVHRVPKAFLVRRRGSKTPASPVSARSQGSPGSPRPSFCGAASPDRPGAATSPSVASSPGVFSAKDSQASLKRAAGASPGSRRLSSASPLPAGARSPQVASERTSAGGCGGKLAALAAAREEARKAWKPHLSEVLLDLMLPPLAAPLGKEGCAGPPSDGRTRGAQADLAREASGFWLAFFRRAWGGAGEAETGETERRGRAKVLRKLSGEENVAGLLIDWIASHVAESSPTFPRGLAPPSQDLPSSPSLSLPPSLPPSSCFSLGGVRECRYTVAAPLVVLGVLLQTLQSLHLRLSLTDQQAASALLLDLRSQAALHEVLQGKKATERREKGERRKSVSSPLRVPSSGRESWPTGAAFVQEKHQTVIRELLLLLATVAGEPAALVCTLHRQLAKTKNRNLVYDVLEAVCVALEHHLRLASPFALSVREKVEKGATWEKWEKSSLALSFSAVELSSTFPAYAAAQAQFAEFLLGQMVPRICQILTGPVLVEDKERREGERLSLKEIALKALALCNSVTKGGVLNASSLHLTAELRSRLCELGKSLASAVAPLSCFPLPPHERCSDYVFAAPVPVALSLPVSQRRTDSSRVSSSLERLGRGEKGGDGSTSLARERSRGASREKLAQPKRADGAPPGKEKPDTATKNEQRESAQALEPPALAGAQDLAEKEATGKTPKQEAEPEERKREAAQGEGARGKDDFDFLDTGLQNLIRERRQEQQALVDTMRETDRQTTALRSGAAFEPVLAQVQEAKEAAEACFSSLQTAHREQSVKALGSIAAQQMRAEEAHANCHCLPCFLPASSAPAAAPGVDPEGPLEKLPRSFSLLHRPAGREEKTDEGLVGAVVSMVKLWCGELYEKDVVRLERAAHCLLYLFTNIPLDPTTTRACADFSVDSGSPLTFPSLASLRREEENWGPRDGDASRALPLCAVVEQLFASRAAKAQANSPVAATSSSGAFLAGLSAEADAVLFHAEASSLVSSVLFESLLHGLDNIFNPAFFDGSTSVAIASFHTILSLLLLLEVLLRKLLAPSKAPEPPSSSAKASAREAPRALLQWKPLEVSGAAPGEDGEEGTAGGSEGASAELLGPTAMARACKQLLLCMSRYQAFVYKAAAPAAKELLLPRLLVTTLLNQCLGKNMLRGSLPSLTSLVAFVFTLAGEQMHGMYPDLNADTSWRFLSKIHRRVTTKLLDAKWDGASRNGCEWSSKESREESLAEGKVLSERKRLQQVIPQDHLLQLVHAVLSSWFILEGRHEAAVVTLQQRQKLVEDETQKAETGRAPAGRSRSGFASFVEKQRSLAFIYFRLFMHTLVRFCSEALGKYLLAQRISSTSVQGKRLETLLSSADPLSSAGAPTAFAALEAAVKGASEAREGLRGFSCSACIALARRAEEGKDVLEKEDEVQEGDKKKRTLSSESEETTGSLAPRERKERRTGEEGRREKRLCFGEEVKTFVASAVDAEQAKLAELMKRRLIAPLQDPLAHVGDGDAAPETASALHLLRSRFRNAFCLVAQQPFDTADDLSLQPYLSDIRARLCRAQVDLEQQDVLCAADSGSDGARLFGRGQTSAKTWRDRLVDFLTRSVALMDVFPVPDQGRGRTGCAWAAGPACVGLLSVENVEGRSGEEVQGGEQVARGASRGDSHWAASFPSGKRWVNLDAVANMFKIEVPQFGRGGGDTKRPESGPDRRPGLLAGKHEAREGRSGAVLTQEVRRHGEAGAGPRAREDPVEREKLSREEEGRAHEKRHSKEETDDAGAKACSQAALGTHGREPPSRHDSSVLAGIAGGGGVEASNAASASAAERLGQPDPHRSETHVHETISQQFTRETTRVTQETFDPRQPKVRRDTSAFRVTGNGHRSKETTLRGGTHATNLLHKHLDSLSKLSGHQPVSELPDSHTGASFASRVSEPSYIGSPRSAGYKSADALADRGISGNGGSGQIPRCRPASPEGPAKLLRVVGADRSKSVTDLATPGSRDGQESLPSVEGAHRSVVELASAVLPSGEGRGVCFPSPNSLLKRDDVSLGGVNRTVFSDAGPRGIADARRQRRSLDSSSARGATASSTAVGSAERHRSSLEGAQGNKKTCLRRSERSPMRLSPEEASLETAPSIISPTERGGEKNWVYSVE
uniref:HEAT repeat-containing protein n=1 Tax=Neospora caninum (strain Liverpool) TaxID=572307 RepID=A0A0F7UBZ8_NEOCL|nr:TPA: HEAT repeat-containing protein [Neospora caninum Liverpool]